MGPSEATYSMYFASSRDRAVTPGWIGRATEERPPQFAGLALPQQLFPFGMPFSTMTRHETLNLFPTDRVLQGSPPLRSAIQLDQSIFHALPIVPLPAHVASPSFLQEQSDNILFPRPTPPVLYAPPTPCSLDGSQNASFPSTSVNNSDIDRTRALQLLPQGSHNVRQGYEAFPNHQNLAALPPSPGLYTAQADPFNGSQLHDGQYERAGSMDNRHVQFLPAENVASVIDSGHPFAANPGFPDSRSVPWPQASHAPSSFHHPQNIDAILTLPHRAQEFAISSLAESGQYGYGYDSPNPSDIPPPWCSPEDWHLLPNQQSPPENIVYTHITPTLYSRENVDSTGYKRGGTQTPLTDVEVGHHYLPFHNLRRSSIAPRFHSMSPRAGKESGDGGYLYHDRNEYSDDSQFLSGSDSGSDSGSGSSKTITGNNINNRHGHRHRPARLADLVRDSEPLPHLLSCSSNFSPLPPPMMTQTAAGPWRLREIISMYNSHGWRTIPRGLRAKTMFGAVGERLVPLVEEDD